MLGCVGKVVSDVIITYAHVQLSSFTTAWNFEMLGASNPNSRQIFHNAGLNQQLSFKCNMFFTSFLGISDL